MEAPKIKRIFDQKNRETIINKELKPNTQIDLITKPFDNNTFFSMGLNIEDIDQSVIELMKFSMDFTLNKNKVSLFDFSLQKYSENGLTVGNIHENNSFQLPFFILTKENVPQKGTNLNKNYNIASEELFTVKKIQRLSEKGDVYYDVYQIPQPVNIDLYYTLEFVGETLDEVNKIAEKIITEFASREIYICPKGYYLPLTLEDVSDQSEDSIDKRRFYSQKYNMICRGYILNQENFRISKTLKNINFNLDLSKSEKNGSCYVDFVSKDCMGKLEMNFFKKGSSTIIFKSDANFSATDSNFSDFSDFSLLKNGVNISLPFNLIKNDVLSLTYNKKIIKNFKMVFYS